MTTFLACWMSLLFDFFVAKSMVLFLIVNKIFISQSNILNKLYLCYN